MAKKTASKRGFGTVRKLPSGRHQARYVGPDGERHTAPRTFESSDDAIGWLVAERKKIDLGIWEPPVGRAGSRDAVRRGLTLSEYAERWFAESEGRHKPRYRRLNRGLIDRQIIPTIGSIPLTALTAQDVRGWFAGLGTEYPTRNANAYGLLRTILNQAVDDELISVNPCRIRGAAMKHRVREPVALSSNEIRLVAAEMPEQWRALVLVAGFSGLRWGELTALRRRDVDISGEGASLTVHRAVVRVKGAWIVGRPKSEAARRTVPLPDPLRPILIEHMNRYSAAGPNGLVFPAQVSDFLHRENVKDALHRAGKRIGFDNLVPHDLRHSAATLFAEGGATLADHMTLMGHTSAAMSARYTHSTAVRARGIAQNVWGVVNDA